MKKNMFIPIGGFLGALLIVLLLVFPMLSMEVKDIKIGVVSIDKGITTPQGKVVLGDEVVKKLITSDNKLLKFEKVNSKKKLKKDLEDGKYYATFIIPKTFTIDSQQNNSKIDVTINEGLQPMVTMQLKEGLNVIGEKTGMNLDIKSINNISNLGMKALLLPMLLVMMTFITSLITSLLVSLNIKDKNKVIEYLKQLLYIFIMTFIISFTITFIAFNISKVNLDYLKSSLYLSTVSISLMLFINGSIKLLGKKGIVLPILLFILGMGLIQLPYEYINSIWQTLIASWEPFRYIGIGLREVLYQNHSIINNATLSLIILSIVGIAFSITSIVRKTN